MKRVLSAMFIMAVLVVSGCSDKLEEKEKTSLNSGKVSQNIEIGKKLKDFTLKNQFDKEFSLQDSTKKVIFVFTKPTGHLVREYLLTKPQGFLEEKHILFIGDVSGMPGIIFKMFALPDFQKSKYSVLLIRDKEESKAFRNEEHKDEVMIIELDKKIVTAVKFISTKKDLIEELEK
jgi:hypothetical protein